MVGIWTADKEAKQDAERDEREGGVDGAETKTDD